jgi:hypothetical protein
VLALAAVYFLAGVRGVEVASLHFGALDRTDPWQQSVEIV